MGKEESFVRRSKFLHKSLILTIKYVPMVISMFYILNIILCWLGIDAPVLSNIAGVSLLTWVVLFLCAVVFRFCAYHKMFLYYILLNDLLNIYDYCIGLPLEAEDVLEIHSVLIGLLLFSILFIYLKTNDKVNKKYVIESS